MMRTTRHASFAGVIVAAALVLISAPVAAQTGGIRGKVTDAAGKPVEGAQVLIVSAEGPRKYELKTDKRGEFVQIGLFPGEYNLTVTKETLKAETRHRVGLGDAGELAITLRASGPSDEQKKRHAELTAIFEAGVVATKAENYDEAIKKFEEAAAIAPTCADCYYNIGYAYMRKKDLDNAALAYEKAAEIRPNHAPTWNELSSVYNLQKKHDKAMEASNKAAELAGAATPGGGGSAPALYNQGVILWNQNKYPEAKEKFEAAAKADPKHGDSQFMLGMAYLNLGDTAKAVTAFESYLQVSPSGPNAEKAKQFIAALKQ